MEVYWEKINKKLKKKHNNLEKKSGENR